MIRPSRQRMQLRSTERDRWPDRNEQDEMRVILNLAVVVAAVEQVG